MSIVRINVIIPPFSRVILQKEILKLLVKLHERAVFQKKCSLISSAGCRLLVVSEYFSTRKAFAKGVFLHNLLITTATPST